MPAASLPAVPVQAYDDLEHFETPFVVKLHRFNPLADTQVGSCPLVYVQAVRDRQLMFCNAFVACRQTALETVKHVGDSRSLRLACRMSSPSGTRTVTL